MTRHGVISRYYHRFFRRCLPENWQERLTSDHQPLGSCAVLVARHSPNTLSSLLFHLPTAVFSLDVSFLVPTDGGHAERTYCKNIGHLATFRSASSCHTQFARAMEHCSRLHSLQHRHLNSIQACEGCHGQSRYYNYCR